MDRAANPEIVAAQVEEMQSADQYKFNLFRFTAKAKSGHTLSTEFDEWKPRLPSSKKPSGADTIDYIERMFLQWYEVGQNQSELLECARELVRARHERCNAAPARWERFSACHEYDCRQQLCESVEPFHNRDDFEIHLIREHGFRPGEPEFIDELRECQTSFPYKNRPGAS